jgi:predicted enzyme related to lactoylglutathione lyase
MHERGEPVADIGHVHLKVSDLERAIGFNRDPAAFKRVLLTHRNRAITRDAVLPANRPASGGGTDRTVDRCHGDSGTHVSICIRS